MSTSAAIADLLCEASFVKREAFFVSDSEVSLTRDVAGIFRTSFRASRFTGDAISSLDRARDPEQVEGRRTVMNNAG